MNVNKLVLHHLYLGYCHLRFSTQILLLKLNIRFNGEKEIFLKFFIRQLNEGNVYTSHHN